MRPGFQGPAGDAVNEAGDAVIDLSRPARGAIVAGLGEAMSDTPVSREFWNRLIREVRNRTRGRADPEELLQAAYLRLVRYRSEHAVENVGAFLVRTAVNIGVDNYRHDKFIADVAPDDGGACEKSPLQDEVLAARARLERVREGLSRLTPRTREVFLMHRLDDMKYREIAERLGISQSAVEKHIAKAALFLTEWAEGW
ncbi:MAG TPA: sigma-70 family RNA polymerase sigma factor [Rhizomicrobium sp.]|nr:sigma-70 family RNA polymerase sigma factor [Rhizomicrobium sp.]